VRVDHIALPNLVAGRRVVPELVQRDCTAESIAAALADYLDRPELAAAARQGLSEVRERLGDPGVFERAAESVLGELDAVGETRSAGGD
jgi:lipid-A-disaccharide synthase